MTAEAVEAQVQAQEAQVQVNCFILTKKKIVMWICGIERKDLSLQLIRPNTFTWKDYAFSQDFMIFAAPYNLLIVWCSFLRRILNSALI